MERGSSERLCCWGGGWGVAACVASAGGFAALRAAVGLGLVWVRARAPSLVCGGFAGRIFFCLLWTQERARCLYSYSCCVALARLAFAFFLCPRAGCGQDSMPHRPAHPPPPSPAPPSDLNGANHHHFTSASALPACPDYGQANFTVMGYGVQGFGNRLGYLITSAGIAAAFDRSVATYWYTKHLKRQLSRDYDFEALEALIEFPAAIQFVAEAEWHQLQNIAATVEIPHTQAGQYIPELAWQMWGRPVKLGGWEGIKRCPKRSCVPNQLSGYLAAIRRVQAKIQPLRPRLLLLPPAREYFVVHLRRGDKSFESSTPAALGLSNDAWAAVESIAAGYKSASRLPWAVISDDGRARIGVESLLRSRGHRILELEPLNVTRAMDGLVDEVTDLTQNTVLMLRDFFIVSRAVGVLAHTPSPFQESSFSTVAALMGDAPLLHPYPYAGGHGGLVAQFQLAGNAGAPFRGMFYLEEPGSARRNASIVSSYLAALHDRRVRTMEIDTTVEVPCDKLPHVHLRGGSQFGLSCDSNASKSNGQPHRDRVHPNWPFNAA